MLRDMELNKNSRTTCQRDFLLTNHTAVQQNMDSFYLPLGHSNNWSCAITVPISSAVANMENASLGFIWNEKRKTIISCVKISINISTKDP